jgi:hypothetical protein
MAFLPGFPDVWQLKTMNDEKDLLKVYTHRNVKSIAFERLSYSRRELLLRGIGGKVFA